MSHNGTEPPRLGDRVVNLHATGVPFGLRGTVVAIHTNTGYVEAIFDEEFVGGRGLQVRGALSRPLSRPLSILI